MTPEQALQILVNAAALAHMPMQDHAACQQAAKVLQEAIKQEETKAE